MTPDELDDLIYRYLAVSMDEAEYRRLESLLAADPASARRFAELSIQETLLHGMGEANLAVECEPADASSKKLRPIAMSRSSFWRMRLFVGIAAAVVLIASSIVFFSGVPSDKTELTATVIEIRGSASLQAGTKSVSISKGSRVAPGETLKTVANSEVRLQYPDNTIIETLPGSELTLLDLPENQKRLRLVAGVLQATVSKQPANLPLVINTPKADVTVVGTVFKVHASEAQTRLEVREGTVRMTRLADHAELSVGSGQSAMVTPQVALPLTSFTIPDGTYIIKAAISGLALADENSRAIQHTYTSDATQQWAVTNLGDTLVKIVCVGTDRALENPGSSTVAGTSLGTANFSNGLNQQWKIAPVSGGRYVIINASSNLEVNVAYSATDPGRAICQWVVGDYPNGVWNFIPVDGTQAQAGNVTK